MRKSKSKALTPQLIRVLRKELGPNIEFSILRLDLKRWKVFLRDKESRREEVVFLEKADTRSMSAFRKALRRQSLLIKKQPL
jgi:hypothetical protein